ncbi:biotin/lipoyl-binding protein, partial [Klebsiella pneumoniae]|nr:biotin/lipoyl-binding protein [Klebsiella pneumoniae]
NPNHIAATMPGTVIKLLVAKGDKVNKGDHLMINEAMKMETTVQAPFSGTIENIHVANGEAIQTGDLLIEMKK